jgi:hypothetical protein
MKEERNLTFLVLLMFNAYSANPNVVLAVTKHGGQLGFFEGITAHSVWYIKTLIVSKIGLTLLKPYGVKRQPSNLEFTLSSC